MFELPEDYLNAIQAMKPNHIDEDKPKQVQRLKEIMSDRGEGKTYAAEEKIDGCHYFMIGNRFLSTEQKEKTHNFPHLRDFFNDLNMPNLVLDGEIYYPGKTSQFVTRVSGSSADVAIANQEKFGPIHYIIWDIIRTPKGTWLINEPFWKRRQVLEQFYAQVITQSNNEINKYITLTPIVYENKQAFFNRLIEQGKEGVVLKRLDSIYVMGKKPAWQWIKMKQKDEVDLFITGYEDAKQVYEGKNIENWQYWREIRGVLTPVTKYYYNNWIGAIELSAYQEIPVKTANNQIVMKRELRKVCTCSGIDEELRRSISANPNNYLGRVVKISYMEKTEDGNIRHPRFEMFHEGKRPEECIWPKGE